MRHGYISALIAVLALLCDAGAWAATGRTAGNFQVSADGSANYSIPIWTPPGVAGLQPSLALNYNSRSGNGLLGIGWQLAGLSAISRCNLTNAQDGVAGSPQLASTDRFCLDGNRLRTTNGSTYGAAGATYQTEIADFSNVTSNGTAGSGPAWFKVQAKNGLTYEYGNTTDSAILAIGTSSVRIWALNAVRDRNGNAMTFTYTNDTTNGSYRPANIQYTYTGSSTTNNGYSVVFTYQTRPSTDVAWSYTIGGVNNQLNYLSSVTVNTISGSTATMVHGYVLTYVTAPTTSRLRISTIQECASSTSDCFPASSITYQDGATGWGAEIANSGNVTNMAYALPIDVNGDGIDDLVYPDPTSGHWYYELGTASGTYAGPYDTGIASTNYQSALAIDFYVNGRKDILVPNSSNNWRVLQFVSAGATFSYVDTTTSAAGVVPGSATVGDVDGDGREDLIYAVSGGSGYGQPDYIYYRLNTGGAFSSAQGTLASFPNGVTCSPCVKLGNSQPFGNPGYRYNSQIRKLDFNGDGRTDFLVYLGSCSPDMPAQCGTTFPITYSWTIFLSQPDGTYVGADAVNYTIGGTPNQPPLIADFNGDGCSDIAYTVNSVWNVQFGTCGRAGATTVLGTAVSTGIYYTNSPALALDWDGDGRADLVQPNSAAHWAVARSTGNTLSAWVDTGIASQSATVVQVADANGDGQQDLTYMVSNALKTRLHNGAGQPPDLVSSITDGYGNSVSPAYVPITQNYYFAWGDQVYPYQDYLGPLYIVYQATFSDPSNPGGTYNQQFYYAGASMNLQGRGFAGFGAQQRYDSRNGIWETWNRNRAFPYTGMLNYDVAAQDNLNNKPINWLTNTLTSTTLDGTVNNQRYFPYVSSANNSVYEVGGTKDAQLITTASTSYTYDNYGNATNVATTLTDKDTGSPYLNQQWTTTTATSYTPSSGTNWCLNMPTERDVTNTAPGVPALTRHVGYTPDYSYCRQTQQVVEAGSTLYQVTTALGYDSFGNLNGQTVTGVGMAARTTGIDWGASGQFPTQVTNALNQITKVSFDPVTGKPLSLTDPNGIMTSWQYDTFARKTKEIRPDATSTTWTYALCSGCDPLPRLAVTQQVLDTAGHVITTSGLYYDMMDRQIYRQDTLLSGATAWTSVRYFDSLGRVKTENFPYLTSSSSPGGRTYTYDGLNRLTQMQRPISASNSTLQTTMYTYQGRTSTVTDPQNKVTTTITKVTGSLGRTKDHNGYYINFNHDAFGSVLSVTDSLSNTLNTTAYGYGIQAFPQTSTDMDLGARSYTVDALGELTAYSDAKNQNFSVIYDALSRPTSRTEPDLTTTWTWGTTAASYNIGRLQSVSSASSAGTYSESYTYASGGQLTDRQFTIPSYGTIAFDYGYSATTGLMETLIFPGILAPTNYRLTAGLVYQNGILQKIVDSSNQSTVWWQANATNARGQITQETTADLSSHPQIVSNRAYDAVTGWLGSIQTGVGGGATLQNESYLYDQMGNVTQRQNNNAGLTENFYYDNVYRLDHSTLGSTTNLQMGYDATGNITSRSDVAGGASWTYDPVRKHAVTQAGSSSYTYTYDPNGNVSTRNGTTIGWTSYNYPSSVGTSTESASFDYGPDRQRWRMIYNGPSGPETTNYATPMFERVVTSTGTDYRHYIYAGGRPVVVISRNSAGVMNVRSLLVDHQGSISAVVTDQTGALSVGESFTAYGNRRDATTWTGAPTSSDRTLMDSVTREGYTFQTVLGSMGLNHMNGRIEDAITGRFLSSDPTVPAPGNTQSYNRYSYVNNNPLTYVDPTGFYSVCVDQGDGNISCEVIPEHAPLPTFPPVILPPYQPGFGPPPYTPHPPLPVLPPIAQPPPKQPPPKQPPAQDQQPAQGQPSSDQAAQSKNPCPNVNPSDFSKDVFLNNQYGPASSVGSKYGVDPSLLVGLSALESGWGSSPMYRSQSNPFGATPGGDSTSGLSYSSYSAAWNSWGNTWGPRVNGVGSDVNAFTGALTVDNRGNTNAVDRRGSYNSENPLWSASVGATISSVQTRLPGALAAFSAGCH